MNLSSCWTTSLSLLDNDSLLILWSWSTTFSSTVNKFLGVEPLLLTDICCPNTRFTVGRRGLSKFPGFYYTYRFCLLQWVSLSDCWNRLKKSQIDVNLLLKIVFSLLSAAIWKDVAGRTTWTRTLSKTFSVVHRSSMALKLVDVVWL